VRLLVDGSPVEAREGEPVAVSLLAAGCEVVARSVKFHRPRGPFCFAGRCEGCLARVDGTPNLATCRIPAKDGMRIERQNAFPSADADLLRTVDWFFRHGMDHHEFLAWLPEPLHTAMRATARRVSGLGLLPENEGPKPTFETVDADVVVVGAGPAGLAAAEAAAQSGARTLVVDEGDEPGGHLLQRPDDAGPAEAVALLERARGAGATIRTGTRVLAFHDGERMIAAGDTGLVDLRAKRWVLATGTHPQPLLYPGNDLPGTISARAAVGIARRFGVLAGRSPAVVGEPALAAPIADFLTRAGAAVVRAFGDDVEDLRARGQKSVRGVALRRAGRRETHDCDAIVVAARGAPAFELAGQAGCPTEMRGFGFVVTSGAGKTRVAGEVAGHEGAAIVASGTAAGGGAP